MRRPHPSALLIGLALLWATGPAAEPRHAPEIEPGPTCGGRPIRTAPAVRMEIALDGEALERRRPDGWIALNHRGYGYRVENARRPATRAPEDALPSQ